MAKKTENTLLFALIEAGALSRQAALAPLRDLGLQAGDDAVLLWLKGNPETDFSDMQFELGLDKQTLRATLFRFQNAALITCQPTADQEGLDITLTDAGQRQIDSLEHHWQTLDRQLRGQIKSKKRKRLKKALHKLADSF